MQIASPLRRSVTTASDAEFDEGLTYTIRTCSQQRPATRVQTVLVSVARCSEIPDTRLVALRCVSSCASADFEDVNRVTVVCKYLHLLTRSQTYTHTLINDVERLCVCVGER